MNNNIDNNTKSIIINGTGTKYEMKKVLKEKKEPKKRVDSEKWQLTENDLTYENQYNALVRIQKDLNNNLEDNLTNFENLITSQIKTKLSSYKQQDILKKILNEEKLITFEKTINLLVDSQLKCHYCSEFMNVVYEIVRMNKQWSLDRIDNNQGHNHGNLVISCLACNLKRRRVNKDDFFMTKNMKIIREGLDGI